jgi:hypothetical protein
MNSVQKEDHSLKTLQMTSNPLPVLNLWRRRSSLEVKHLKVQKLRPQKMHLHSCRRNLSLSMLRRQTLKFRQKARENNLKLIIIFKLNQKIIIKILFKMVRHKIKTLKWERKSQNKTWNLRMTKRANLFPTKVEEATINGMIWTKAGVVRFKTLFSKM